MSIKDLVKMIIELDPVRMNVNEHEVDVAFCDNVFFYYRHKEFWSITDGIHFYKKSLKQIEMDCSVFREIITNRIVEAAL